MLQLRGNGLGYDDSSPCSSIPAGDAYRTSGNYCTQPSGNIMAFNADGSIDADPFSPGAAATPANSSTPGGDSGLTTAAVGVVGLLMNLVGKPASTTPVIKTGAPMPVPAAAWYTTWWGLGLLGVGGYFAYKTVKGSPTKAA